MKTTFIMACLMWLSFGISVIPAQALVVSIGNYDHNRDGRWDRREYYNANYDWHRHHDRVFLPQREVYRQFDAYDTDHDGYLNQREVRAIRTW